MLADLAGSTVFARLPIMRSLLDSESCRLTSVAIPCCDVNVAAVNPAGGILCSLSEVPACAEQVLEWCGLRVAANTLTGPWIPWQNWCATTRDRAAKSVAKSCIEPPLEPPSGIRPSVGIRVYLTKLLRKVIYQSEVGCHWLSKLHVASNGMFRCLRA